jgi:hypothetical protein
LSIAAPTSIVGGHVVSHFALGTTFDYWYVAFWVLAGVVSVGEHVRGPKPASEEYDIRTTRRQ